MREKHDIRKGRLAPSDYAQNFCDVPPPLNRQQSIAESSRCYFCHDAPCVEACPTEINIPEFIRRIQTGNLKGAATEILSANILGGTCSRVCPVEILCERACVRNTSESKPVTIGLLQRHATDWLFEKKIQPFVRELSTGKTIAVIGAGPAGLSCAHRLAMLGHEVEIFDSKPKPGGLNEYGIAAYKMTQDFAQREIQFLLDLGGITIHTGRTLGRDLQLPELRKKYDATFLAIGLGGVNALGVDGETLPGVLNAVDAIAEIRQNKNLASIAVGRRVVIIGGGNTAIDIAIQSRRLGAEEVTLVYRRGTEQMSATHHEQELAQTNGVLIRTWARPLRIIGDAQGVSEITFETTRLGTGGTLEGTGSQFSLHADQIFKAVGQLLISVPSTPSTASFSEVLETKHGKIWVNERRETSLSEVYAGGDCIDSGEDLTVVAVQDGKLAAFAIDERLTGRTHPWPT